MTTRKAPEEVKQYRSRDGILFDTMTNAGYRDQLLDLREACSNAIKKLTEYVRKCEHPEYSETGTQLALRETDVQDEWGTYMSDQVEQVTYKCKCCGAIGHRWVDSDQIVFYRPVNPMWDA
ncbi:KH domain protein [Vibrio phage vB_VpS_PG07]|uniref:KH domain protein n=1 Tax=Vibrio phage vB_VpS_PG07 TaxID=2301664 RepID=A0A385E7E4_9CAUD|nr:KH domain protein [Vibrio phage vB_VpS_PG07]AXQ66658.1 KH domain protein [Vibrio phage vB_VpS_PG07]